jgi:hypothetical protein
MNLQNSIPPPNSHRTHFLHLHRRLSSGHLPGGQSPLLPDHRSPPRSALLPSLYPTDWSHQIAPQQKPLTRIRWRNVGLRRSTGKTGGAPLQWMVVTGARGRCIPGLHRRRRPQGLQRAVNLIRPPRTAPAPATSAPPP